MLCLTGGTAGVIATGAPPKPAQLSPLVDGLGEVSKFPGDGVLGAAAI